MVPRRRRAQHPGQVGREYLATEIPSRWDLLNPTLNAIRHLGGSAHIGEIVESVTNELQPAEGVTTQLHGAGPMTQFEYQLYWARTELKTSGIITNSSHGVWSLTLKGHETASVNPSEVRQTNRAIRAKQKSIQQATPAEPGTQDSDSTIELSEAGEIDGAIFWQEQLLTVLREMHPAAFERLCQRMLREAGFVEVHVTGKSGDEGIDGHGILQMGNLVTLPVYFQCKRYSGSVTPDKVRDFRGAMAGRGERGLLITTGNFTSEAQKEATRAGAQRIDLIDGALLVRKLKDFGLGVNTEMVEQVTIESNWFNSI